MNQARKMPFIKFYDDNLYQIHSFYNIGKLTLAIHIPKKFLRILRKNLDILWIHHKTLNMKDTFLINSYFMKNIPGCFRETKNIFKI